MLLSDLNDGLLFLLSLRFVNCHSKLSDRIVELFILMWVVVQGALLEDFCDVISGNWEFKVFAEIHEAIVWKDVFLRV